jgi:hypothetical protein
MELAPSLTFTAMIIMLALTTVVMPIPDVSILPLTVTMTTIVPMTAVM